MKGLMVYQNGEYKNPILKEQNDIPPSVNKSVEFGPGFYRVKGNYTGKSGTKWSWDVEETLNTELQKIKNFLTKNPSGYIVNVNLSAGESKIPNVDREQNGKKVNPGHLSKNRMETIKNYVQKVFDSWLKEGIIKDKINFSVKNPKIGSTDWVGQPFCPKEKRGDDPQGYKCGKDYRNSPNYKTLKDTYTKEQFVNVSISVDKFEEEGGGGGIPITENCAVGLEIIVQTPKHNCNNAEFFIFANKTLIKNVDGGDTHNGSNSDKEVRINKFNLDSKVLNPAYGKLGTLKYGTTGDNGGARYDKFIITPEQSKKITSQSNDGTMKIWAVCAKSTCHSDLVSITIKHPSKKENVFGPQKVKSNNSILTILSPCGDVSLSDISMGGLEKDAPDVQNFRNKWFKERKELTLKLNNGVEPDGELDFKSTLLHRTSKITDIVDDYVRDIQILFEESQKRKLPENVKRDWFIENFDELSDGDISDYYTELLTGNDEKQPTFAMKKGNQTSIGNGTYSFSHKWVRKDELSGDIRDQMSKVFNVLNQIFQTEGLVIGDLKLRTDIGEKIYKQLKSGKKLKKVKDIQIAVGVDGNSTQLK
tara:strand:+ start:2628 stop:4397 length:1770 start_codon:yes stop_codon:yes gene_type:complete